MRTNFRKKLESGSVNNGFRGKSVFLLERQYEISVQIIGMHFLLLFFLIKEDCMIIMIKVNFSLY